MKTVAMIVRRPDHTRDEFRAHYEDIHAPLAMETVMEGTTRYIRNHITSEIHGAPAFDVVSSFWYRDVATVVGLTKRLEGEEGERIIADEHTFMDRDKNAFFAVTEQPVMGAEDRGAGLSAIALVRAPEGEAKTAFAEAYDQADVPNLLDAVDAPVWCLQNRAVYGGPVAPGFDLLTEVHARGDAGLAGWAAGLEARGASVLVIGVVEHETETPWS